MTVINTEQGGRQGVLVRETAVKYIVKLPDGSVVQWYKAECIILK